MMSLMMQQLCVCTTSDACGSTITEHVQSPHSRDFTTPRHATLLLLLLLLLLL